MKGLCLALLVVAVACEPAPDVEPMVCRTTAPVEAELGGGDLGTGFVDIENGGALTIVLGPQGLHMVVVSLRLQNFELPSAGGGRIPLSVAVRLGDEVVGGTWGDFVPSDVRDTEVEFLGLRAVFTVSEIEPLVGQSAEVVATLRDGCGRNVRIARSLKLVL